MTKFVSPPQMKRIHNANIAHFYGMSPHDLEMSILCEVALRGSLQDVMNNDTVKFDAALKTSVITDLTNVSVLGYWAVNTARGVTGRE